MVNFNFTTIAPYLVLTIGVLTLLLNAIALGRMPLKQWVDWYHKTSILQPIGGVLSGLFFICDVIFLLTYKHNDILAFIAILIGFASAMISLFLYIRVIGLQREAKEKSKTF